MKPCHVLTDTERDDLYALLAGVPGNPYQDYPAFSREVREIVGSDRLPAFVRDIGERIGNDRAAGTASAHVVRNCPIDSVVPELNWDDPVADKYAKKKTFIGEALLEALAQVLGTPLLAYGSRNNGDFFTDVVAISRFSGMQTGFSDSELVYHNDRTAHWARADYISLLGLRCPEQEVICTSFVDGRAILANLGPDEQKLLRQPFFVTSFDAFSQATNGRQTVSDRHPILENSHSFRYTDTTTTVAAGAPTQAKDALLAMKDALVRAEKQRHILRAGDLLTFANQDGLHSRDKIDVTDPSVARTRWLLKCYAFRGAAAADVFADRWVEGVRGRIAD